MKNGARFFSFSIYTFVIILSFSGCNDSVTTPAESAYRTLSKAEGIQYENREGLYNVENIYGHVMLSSIKSSRIEFPNSEMLFEDTYGNFRDLTDSLHYGVNAGTVTLNSTTMPKHTFSSGGTSYGVIDYPVTGGQTYTWDISGNNGYSPLKISCPAPSSKADITFPVQSDSISLNSPLTIRWNGNFDKNSVVSVSLGNEKDGKHYFVDDNGSFTIPVSDLESFGEGIVRIKFERSRFSVATVTTNKFIMATIHSSHSLECIFVNR